MAQQITNTFLKSKMNKDLDDRIMPNGEYRDALNISVGRSEDNDVGALENIIGNSLITSTNLDIPGLKTIGNYADDSSEQIFIFLTNYSDPNPNQPTNAPSSTSHYIYSYSLRNNSYTKLIEGNFLNFSKTNRIIGINLLENLLFWTDNRNQPRKININLATNSLPSGSRSENTDLGYYTEEHQISVAKYNPYQAIQLYKKIELIALGGAGSYFTVAGNRVTELSKYIGGTVLKRQQTDPINGADYVTVASVILIGSNTRVTVSPALANSITAGQEIVIISSNMTNESASDEWPGDPNFLEDRFVRFSYRFKYDDNEYSLMAPFTQIAYIPTQKGYFIQGDEQAAYQSTVVQFMKNNVQNVTLTVPLPDSAISLARSYKIKEIELLFREAGTSTIKVLESIPVGAISAGGIDNVYEYEYQSRKPYKTLPEAQTVRVYDKVPIRAFSQETAGNRIIYGNYIDKHTPPDNLNYNCRISQKSSSGIFNNFVEYPNHSVKRNRNYQIGFVLADKFGRSSPVILSSVDEGVSEEGFFYAGSTIYSPYDTERNETSVQNWFGDAIVINLANQISSTQSYTTGTPGLYAIQQKDSSEGDGYAVSEGNTISNNQYTFTANPDFPANVNYPKVGNFLRGQYKDFVLITAITEPVANNFVVTTVGRVNESYLYVSPNLPETPILRFAYTINDLGWYSYKIVVKQTQQDYYNAYLPGFLDGYPLSLENPDTSSPYTDFPAGEQGKTAHVVLINDNINKIPRDLSEVGPDQRQYRSSVKLYGRVNNFINTEDSNVPATQQYFPRVGTSANAIDDIVSTIATALELEFIPSQITTPSNFYQLNTNPYIARISTTGTKEVFNTTEDAFIGNPIGITQSEMVPALTIYETEADESLLAIYWETTSEGLIADLNADVLEDFRGPTDLTPVNWELEENDIAGDSVTNWIYALSTEGNLLLDAEFELISIMDNAEPSVDRSVNPQNLTIEVAADDDDDYGAFRVIVGNTPLVYLSSSPVIDNFTVNINITADGVTTPFSFGGLLNNNEPTLDVFQNPESNYSNVYFVPANATILLEARTPRENYIENGSANEDHKYDELIFFLVGAPTNWTIDPDSGEISQVAFSTTEGVYDFQIGLADANNEVDTSREDLQDVKIIIRAPDINDGIVPDDCFTGLFSNSDFDPQNASAKKCIICTDIGGPNDDIQETGIWYIAANEITNLDNPGVAWENIPGANNADATGDGVAGNQVFRIGNSAHSRGTLAFTYNFSRAAVGEEDREEPLYMAVENVGFYYRVSGTTTWLPLPRLNDTYNNTGSGDAAYENFSPGKTGASISKQDDPINSSAPEGNYSWPCQVHQDPGYEGDPNIIYATGMRVSDFSAFNGLSYGEELEYAIIVNKLSGSRDGSTGSRDRTGAYAFITVTDLNYSTCLPINGANYLDPTTGGSIPNGESQGSGYALTYDSGNNLSFEYLSTLADNVQAIEDWGYMFPQDGVFPIPNVIQGGITEPSFSLYSNIPYPEFVTQFFTDQELVSPYIPAKTDEDGNNVNGAINYISMIPNPVETPYVNSGDPGGDIQDIPNQYTSWWKNEQFPNRTVPLQWSAIFANGDANGVPDGKKVFPLVEAWDLIGVGSSQVTYLRIDGPNSDPIQQEGDFENTLIDEQKKWGTTRYRQIRKH